MLVRDSKAALSFDGSSAYVGGAATNLPIGSAVRTMSCWINPSVSDGSVRYFMGYGDGTSNKAFELNHDNTRLSIDLAFIEMTYAIKFQIATWYFIATTWDGTTLKLYINGVLVTSATPTVNTLATAGINVGRRGTSGGSYYKGKIDEPRIWNVALTGAQILSLYNTGVAPSGLVLEYMFNEGAGTTVADTSGNANTGTITAATFTADVPFKPRKLVNQNLVVNGDFSYAPPFVAATTFTVGSWIDGSAGGSVTNDLFGWRQITGGSPNNAYFDTVNPHSGLYSLKMFNVTAGAVFNISTISASADAANYASKVLPSTSYTATYWMRTNYTSGAGTGAYVDFQERTGTGAASTDNNGTAVTTTTGWTQYTVIFTTAATTRYVVPRLKIDGAASTLIMDANFSEVTLTPTTPTARLAS